MRLGIGIELYESDVWLVDYLAPQPKLEKKPKATQDKKEAVDPKPKQVDLNNIDDVVKEIADKKSVSK